MYAIVVFGACLIPGIIQVLDKSNEGVFVIGNSVIVDVSIYKQYGL